MSRLKSESIFRGVAAVFEDPRVPDEPPEARTDLHPLLPPQ